MMSPALTAPAFALKPLSLVFREQRGAPDAPPHRRALTAFQASDGGRHPGTVKTLPAPGVDVGWPRAWMHFRRPGEAF